MAPKENRTCLGTRILGQLQAQGSVDPCEVPESGGDQAGLKGEEEALGWAGTVQLASWASPTSLKTEGSASLMSF